MHRYCFVLILFFLIVSCDKKVPKQEVSELQLENDINDETATLIGDPARGKAIYYLNCISCHNLDPKKQGSIGPQIYGSSKELLSKKILFGKYPKNYKPKRSGGAMPIMQNLDKEISNLHAFLNTPSREKT